MNIQQPFIITVDQQRLTFSTEVPPFIFKESTVLVKRLLEDANARTENDRQIILEFNRQILGGGLVCCYMLSVMTIIGLPFFCCYYSSKQKKMMQATQGIIKSWEDVTKVYNDKLVEHGVFVRLVTQPILTQNRINSHNQRQYSYEFSFDNHNNHHIENNNNKLLLNEPPGVIA